MSQEETIVVSNNNSQLVDVSPTLISSGTATTYIQTAAHSGHPQVQLSITVADSDTNSDQVQCIVKLENTGSERVRIHSVRPLNPARTVLQQEVDSASSESKIYRDDLYKDLTNLITTYLLKSSEDYRKSTIESFFKTFKEVMRPKTLAQAYFYIFTNRGRMFMKNMTESQRAWSIEIRNYEHAQHCLKEFLQNPTGPDLALAQIYGTKLTQLKKIEDDISSGVLNDSVADVEPNATFSRTYIYNCQRKLLSPSIFTFSFDVAYSSSSKGAEQKHLSSTVSAAVNPKPIALNIVAVASSVLGAILKISLDQMQNKADSYAIKSTTEPSIYAIVTMPSYDTMIAAMITALFFYNVYESTEIGKKISVGSGWRSALIIGGISGLLNQRVLAALQGLLG